MAITMTNPAGLPEIDGYRQVSIAPLTAGSKLVHVAGQVSWDTDLAPIAEGDLAGQVEQCYLHINTALTAAGGSFDDVVKLNFYVVDWAPEKLPLIWEGINRAAARIGTTPVPPVTLVGVVMLDVPEHLVEVEATAVIG
ncbi:enamine deaminase RidA [Streptomyces ruber]|uniref:Enamine deaminase RidA n=2 Tax=Streptomyces TaxID=1883 RepID=A0A918B6Q8_9ACTN|nr:RidA family protein [Streptomyces ruber]GGQ38378.1 enamine deaminase RidA [Streptomyces ruber]